MSEDEDNIDDDTGSDIIEEKLTSSQSKTRSSPNIVGKNPNLETRPLIPEFPRLWEFLWQK